MLSRELECFLESWNAFYRVGIPLYRVGMLSAGLENFVQSWKTFYRVGMLRTELEYFLQSFNAF
jgi:ABC-type glycerol-3-phosphate transport system permease component